MNKIEKCPNCGSTNIAQEALDIGVGTDYGYAYCEDCHWDQEYKIKKFLRGPGRLIDD